MDPKHKNILLKNRDIISKSVSLNKIKDLLIDFKMFNKYMWEDINSIHEVLDLLPTRGPKAFKNFVTILMKAGYKNEADNLKRSLDIDLYYKLPSKPAGQCLIINIFEFDEKINIDKRLGSDKDVENLTTFFEDIGYSVQSHSDLTGDKMKTCIKDFSCSIVGKVDVVIVFIMSHGSQNDKSKDYVFGSDGKPVFKNTIIDCFNNFKSPHLQGKPKIFFFVACRGKKRDHGVPKLYSSESTDSVSVGDATEFTATKMDMLVVHSTLPEHLSVRDNNFGSWFCQDLICCLRNHYCDHDIEDIMVMVNNSMKERVHIEYGTQVVHRENFGFKKLYLSGKPPSP